MYRLAFFIVCLACHLTAAVPLVYVHLGYRMPGYYHTAMRQAARFNEESDIFLIVQHKVFTSLKRNRTLPKNVHLIDAHTLPISEKHLAFAKIAHQESKYWRYTLERFYYLEAFMESTGITECIHLEGDTLVYRNLTSLLPVFRENTPSIGIPFLSDQMCVPAFIYFGSKEGLSEFTRRIPGEVEKMGIFSDMDFLATMFFETSLIEPLPTTTPSYLSSNREYTSLVGNQSRYPEVYSRHATEFGGLFDSMHIGIWLDGMSPAHAEYKRPKRYEVSIIDPSEFDYTWRKDAHGRRCPYASFDGEEWPIYFLHIHSKDLEKFKS